MRKVFKYILIVLAVILTVGSLSLFTVRQKLLDPDVYTDALRQSGIYEEITDIVEDQLTRELIDVGKTAVAELGIQEKEDDVINNVLVWLLNTIIDTQTGTLVSYISDSVGLENLVQQVSEKAILYALEWLSGERETPEFLKYVPTKAELEAVREINVADVIALVTRRAIGIEDLPECANREELITNLNLVKDGRILKLTCTSPELDEVINQTIIRLIPQEMIVTVESTIQGYIDQANLQPIIDQAFTIAIQVAEEKEMLEQVREYVIASKQVIIWMFVFSLLTMIGALLLAESKRLRLFAIIYFISGIIILVKGVFGYSALPYIILNTVSFEDLFVSGALAPAQTALLIESIKLLTSSIIQNIFSPTMYLGLIMAAVAAVIWIADFIARRYDFYKKTKNYFKGLKRSHKAKKRKKSSKKKK